MDLKGKLKQGMRIFGSDDREYGTIERYDNDNVYVGGRKVPYSAFERIDKGRLYVGQSGSQYFGSGDEGQLRVQVAEERLSVDKQATELGSVNVRKTVETEQVSVPVELMREEVNVQEVDVKDRAMSAADAANAFQETTIRVPVRGEEAVVRKEAVVTGEVVIDRERVTERQTISDTVRKERVDIDENYAKARPNLEQHFEKAGRAGGRTFEAAEPNYRMGYEAAHDERHANRKFEEVEPDLRREHEARATKGSGDSWEHLREEVREGWQRARS